MNPTISVIVPAYNAESFIISCIESILNQSFRDLELILVDDGSTDRTAEICQSFAAKDPRVKYLYKTNGGVIQALKEGVKAATGDWIAFCDHDDTIPAAGLETLYKLTGEDTDLVVGFSYPGDGSISRKGIEEWRRNMVASDVILCTRWAKLYRRTIMDEQTAEAPSCIKMGEDMVMNIKAAFRTGKDVVITQQQVYDYYRNQNSFSVHFKWTALWCNDVYEVIRGILLENGQEEAYLDSLIGNGLGMAKKLIITGSRAEQRNLRTSPLIPSIKKDISRSGYRPSSSERLLLACPASLATRLFLQAGRACTIAARYLKKII